MRKLKQTLDQSTLVKQKAGERRTTTYTSDEFKTQIENLCPLKRGKIGMEDKCLVILFSFFLYSELK